jgi:pyruvate ferredoxin oxidoreductase beta subunit
VKPCRAACTGAQQDVVIANATGCMEIVSSALPTTTWRVPWIHSLFENTAAVASGLNQGSRCSGARKIENKKSP